ncbi:MAG TPA: hypothetical protein VNP72_04710 [Longimicrobium sp.]|nr:hypothetical protein [Longimicrobium sp.]
MNADSNFRRLRGAVGNALVWGAGWAALGFAVFATLKATGVLPASVIWPDAIMVAGRIGLLGGVAGGAFSLAIGVLYRGRRLSELSPVRLAVGTGIAAGVCVPAFLQAMNFLSGGGWVPMGVVLDDGLYAAVFGAVAAGGSLALAQRAQTQLPGGSQDRPDRLEGGNPLASAGERDARRRSAPAPRGG